MTDCTHRWIIEEPNGPTSLGTCKHCGATKEYANGYKLIPFEELGSLRDTRASLVHYTVECRRK